MEAEYTESLTLRACDTDLTGRWRPDLMLLAAQELCSEHCARLGFSRTSLESRGIAWILYRTGVEMKRWPRFGETIRMTTWHGAREKALYPRYVLFTDADGEPLGCIHALWVLVDMIHRRVVLPRVFSADMPVLSPRPAPCPAPDRLPIPKDGTESKRTGLYSELDLNGHVNNTRYAAWMCDLYAPEFYRDHALSSLVITYSREVLPGKEVILNSECSESGFLCAGFDPGDGALCFQARGTFRPVIPGE